MLRTQLTDYLLSGAMSKEEYNTLNALTDKQLADYSLVNGKVIKAITLDTLQAYALYDFNRLQVYALDHADAIGFLPYKDIEIAIWMKAFSLDTVFLAVPTTYLKRVKGKDGYGLVEVTSYQPQLLDSNEDVTVKLAAAYRSIKEAMNGYARVRNSLSGGK